MRSRSKQFPFDPMKPVKMAKDVLLTSRFTEVLLTFHSLLASRRI